MEKKININFDMDVLMNELKEALSVKEIKTVQIEKDSLTEKLAHLFAIKEYDLFLLLIKSLFIKYELPLPDIFHHERCSNKSKESICAVIIKNWFAIAEEVL